VGAETGSDEQAKYKANAHACRRLVGIRQKAKNRKIGTFVESFQVSAVGQTEEVCDLHQRGTRSNDARSCEDLGRLWL
jgi:hypothetical protein